MRRAEFCTSRAFAGDDLARVSGNGVIDWMRELLAGESCDGVTARISNCVVTSAPEIAADLERPDGPCLTAVGTKLKTLKRVGTDTGSSNRAATNSHSAQHQGGVSHRRNSHCASRIMTTSTPA